MKSIVRERTRIRRSSVSDAVFFSTALGEVYKVEMVDELERKWETVIGFYANIGKFQNPVYNILKFLKLSTFNFQLSTFIDMCQWPHVNKYEWDPEDSFKVDKLVVHTGEGDSKNKTAYSAIMIGIWNKKLNSIL